MLKYCLLLIAVFALTSFQPADPLAGTWQFAGGIYNGKPDGAPKAYSLRKKYAKLHYDAFVLEPGQKAVKYESGTYKLKGDTCVDTETFSLNPSKITNIPIHYQYNIRHDTLIFKGVLPTGMRVEEYWKKVF